MHNLNHFWAHESEIQLVVDWMPRFMAERGQGYIRRKLDDVVCKGLSD